MEEAFHGINQFENPSHVPVEAALRKIEDFPEDIQLKILSGVPGESILNCKLVCKRWQKLLSNRRVSLGIYFSISTYRTIIQHYYASYDAIKTNEPEEDFYETRITKVNLPPIKENRAEHDVIVDSCNGLVCLAIPYKRSYCDPVYICNPYTSEYTILPRVSTIKYWVGDIASGFGYLPSTDEYKVVRILYPYKGYKRPASDDKILVQVYTLGKNSSSGWRDITAVPPGLLHREAIFADGSLYWKYLNEDENNDTNGLVAFDLVDESFHVLPTPPCIQFPREKYSVYFIKKLGGHLCVTDHPDHDSIDIWSFRKNKQPNGSSCGDVIEQEYYRDWNWSKDFSIEWEQHGRYYEPFALTKNNQVLIWSQTCIKCYDPTTKSLNVVVGRERDGTFETFKGILHMNTLVSLKDLGVSSKTWVGWSGKKHHRLKENELGSP